MNPYGLIFLVGGGVAIAGAVGDWHRLMNTRTVRFMVAALSRNGARVLYGVLGLVLSVFGLLAATGRLDISP
jgi:hypothetical protein